MFKTNQHFINGQWVDATGNERIDVINPATEKVIGQVPKGSKEDVDKAVSAANHAFPAWNELQPSERAAYVERILELIEEKRQELADTMIEELGSSRQFSEGKQVDLSVNEMRGSLEEFKKFNFEETLEGSTIIKEGIGTVACITPWNYPLNQIQRKATPALLAGNTLVVKPAGETPLTAIIYAQIVEEAGLPAGVFNLVHGDGSETGDYLAGHDDVQVISFTGSTQVGSGLYEKAGKSIKKLILELGGKSPMIYLEGGDLEQAVTQSMSTLVNNSGQSCSALSRLLVPADRLDETKDLLKDYIENQVVIGDPKDDKTVLGPMSSKEQKETVLDYNQKGKEEGAELFIGGEEIDRQGHYVEPTVFTKVTNDMTIAQEEIFGPVLAVLTYESVEEAIAIANDSDYGLSGAVVGPAEEAKKVARQLRTGNIIINGGDSAFEKLPFGGYKMSGLGREKGNYGLEDYLEVKALIQ